MGDVRGSVAKIHAQRIASFLKAFSKLDELLHVSYQLYSVLSKLRCFTSFHPPMSN